MQSDVDGPIALAVEIENVTATWERGATSLRLDCFEEDAEGSGRPGSLHKILEAWQGTPHPYDAARE